MSAIRPHSKRERRRSSNVGQLLGRSVAGNHDLLHALVQRVEGVEELLLGALLAGQELDVVDQQHVDVAEACRGSWSSCRSATELIISLVNFSRREIADGGLRLAALDLVADGLHQMGLAHADAAVQEKRVVGLNGRSATACAAAMANWFPLPITKASNCVARVELRRSVPVEARLLRHGCAHSVHPAHARLIRVVAGDRRESPVFAHPRRAGVLRGSGEYYRVDVQRQIVDGLLDQVPYFSPRC